MLMKDSSMTDEWITTSARNNPCVPVLSPDGVPTGAFRFPPARLGYCAVFEAEKSRLNPNAEPKFNAVVLFPPNPDLGPAIAAYNEMLRAEWPAYHDPQTGQPRYGDGALTNPFRMCDDRRDESGVPLTQKSGMGYTPGCFFTSMSSQYRPNIVDARGQPIIDKTRLYSGAWVIICANPYAYPTNKQAGAGARKGVKFGLQAIMLVQDDDKIGGGGAVSAQTAFAGVNAATFGAGSTAAAQAAMAQPAGAMPGMPGAGLVPTNPAPPSPKGGAQFPTYPATDTPPANPMAAFGFK